jgi:prefoldin subunit 5
LTWNLFQAGTATSMSTSFELNDTLYARATIAPEDTNEVYLWLGANVMLAYPIDEAESLLEEKLRAAESSLANCEEDLEFLREQITVRFPFVRFCHSESILLTSQCFLF